MVTRKNNEFLDWFNIESNLKQKVETIEIDMWIESEGWSIDLKQQWTNFKNQMVVGDELWSYRYGGVLSMRMGYAIKRNDKVISCFPTAMS